ncbi:hypothetical protein PT974_08012 [Cladobotryum mycophilum]|uniref:Uncharacterized protein n=1 Tax=Cladobotryum mycophilum TaxID=491253 RepID=A0ABR0SC50_9HYPO
MSMLRLLNETGKEALENIESVSYACIGRGAIVFGLRGQGSLQDWLQSQDAQQPSDGDLVIVVPCVNGIIHEDRDGLTRLCATWDIPGRAIRHLLTRVRGHGSMARQNDSEWQLVTLVTPSGESTASIRMAICSKRQGKPNYLRTIVTCNAESFGDVEHTICEFMKMDFDSSSLGMEMRPLWFSVLISEISVQAWMNMKLDWSSDSERLLQDFRDVMKDVDLSPAMSEVGRWRNIARRSTFYTDLLWAYLDEAKARISTLKKNSDKPEAFIPLEEYVQNLQFPINSSRETFRYLREHLDGSLQMYSTIIEINGMNLVRQNIDSMRRIAESSEAQADEMREYAKESRKDSRDMRRLAFLTMFYLPATAVATIFSIPFLALDDNLQFKAVRKIWIFLVVSVVMTTLTFIASGLWDKFSARKHRMAEMFAPAKSGWTAGNPNPTTVEPEAISLSQVAGGL